ncbi:AbrB family transcriptional regulator [Oceanisphaera sp. IT1-181]|uniref:AbrB family transcriptional regulator n=1 Tax=Oceanisphaera sp. IT1-181 TaxID=3081199 RepID=UPI0029CA093F|nr:AbrB family transcriptional regulator [Oceanisphaera sp. IT1-181]
MMIWLRTCALGAAGGWLAHRAGFPSDWLLGAMLIVALAAMAGLDVRLPKTLLAPIQACLGVAVGLRLEFDFPAPSSLLFSVAGLLLCLATQIPLGQYMLRRLGWSSQEAVMGASPGALSIMAALATQLDNPIRVILSQTVRVIALVALVSVIMLLEWVPTLGIPTSQELSLTQTLGLVFAAWLLGRGGAWLKIPASYILTGVAVSATYGAWLGTPAVPVNGLIPVSMILLGALVGSRLKPLPAKDMLQLLLVGLLISVSSSVISLLWAFVVGTWLGLPVFQVWLAYAPGAVEAMIYLALVTGLDPSWVIFHHVLRILLLGLCAGWLMRRAGAGTAPA